MAAKAPLFAIQYLEPSPVYHALDPAAVRAKLRAAFACLPIQYLLIGWDLPQRLVAACAEEAAQAKVQFYRWQPLLTDDGMLQPTPAWQTIGLQGEPVPGFQQMAEFTFVCPNRPVVREAIFSHLHHLARHGGYQGFFLDRMRFPSPAADPTRWLACICPDCQHVAGAEGLDLAALAPRIVRLLHTADARTAVLRALFHAGVDTAAHSDLVALNTFLDFRSRSITRFVRAAADLLHADGVKVGLDTFSPALTRLVGQDLATLAPCADWVKPMSYCHTLGPAGLPFELLDLAQWFMTCHRVNEVAALATVATASGLPLPSTFAALRTSGLPAATLRAEMIRARRTGVKTLLAGVELVEIPGVTRLTASQIAQDHGQLQASAVDGLVLSWDLWQMPLARLQQVAALWGV